MAAWWEEEAEEELLSAVMRSVRDIQQEVVLRTRIKTGRAKSSWNVSVGSPDFTVDPAIRDDNESTWITREVALTKARGTLSRLNDLSVETATVYISNGVSYIQKLENMDAMSESTVHWAATFMPVTVTGQVERG